MNFPLQVLLIDFVSGEISHKALFENKKIRKNEVLESFKICSLQSQGIFFFNNLQQII